MKGKLIKVLALTLAFSLAAQTAAYAGPVVSFYDRVQKVAQPGLVYTAVPHIGLPVEVSSSTNNKTGITTYTYIGDKKIICDFKSPDVSLSAVSNTKDLEARARENYIYIENIGLKTGDSATVTLTATHKTFGRIVQEIKVTLTDGSLVYPHLVANKEDLIAVNSLGVNKYYRQTADIDLEGFKEWAVIGNEASPFTGVYNGNGYKITNIEFDRINSQCPALFGVVKGRGAKITDLNIEGNFDTLHYPVNAHGTVVGVLDEGTVSGCSFKGSMTFRTGKMIAGGIASEVRNDGVVRNCSVSAKIKSQNNDSFIGGVVGALYGKAEDCEFKGEIISEATEREANIGGIAGLNKGSISGSAVVADLSAYGASGYLGGSAGYNYGDIKDSAYSGKLYSKGSRSRAGGIAGLSEGLISGCAVKGEFGFIGDDSYIGGIAGQNVCGTIENSVCEAPLTGQGTRSSVGGIAGENYTFINHDNVKSIETVLAAITRCAFSGDVKISGSSSFAGGIAGRNFGYTMVEGGTTDNAKSHIEKCAVKSGVITAENGAKAGRIVAENKRDTVGDRVNAIQTTVLSDNAAFEGTLLNGEPAAENLSGDGINGETLDSDGIEKFIIVNNITTKGKFLN